MKVTTRFNPKLFELMRGYSRERFIKDVGAGLTVSVVALPLAMAFAIASGLPPQSGLFTAIIAGFLISLFSGSRVQRPGGGVYRDCVRHCRAIRRGRFVAGDVYVRRDAVADGLFADGGAD